MTLVHIKAELQNIKRRLNDQGTRETLAKKLLTRIRAIARHLGLARKTTA